MDDVRFTIWNILNRHQSKSKCQLLSSYNNNENLVWYLILLKPRRSFVRPFCVGWVSFLSAIYCFPVVFLLYFLYHQGYLFTICVSLLLSKDFMSYIIAQIISYVYKFVSQEISITYNALSLQEPNQSKSSVLLPYLGWTYPLFTFQQW